MRIVSAALIILAIVIGVGGFINSAGVNEAATNTTDTQYGDVAQTTTDTAITVLHVIGGIASIIGVAILLIAVGHMDLWSK